MREHGNPTSNFCYALRRLENAMNDEQINKMVDRFLGWKLPKDFAPDAGINFTRTYKTFENGELVDKERTQDNFAWWPVGTNLFTAAQAKAMILHMLGEVETREYSDGTVATGIEPLPELSPAQQDAGA